MTHEEAREIIESYHKWNDVSCTCFQGYNPCGKCEKCPSEELYSEALNFLGDNL